MLVTFTKPFRAVAPGATHEMLLRPNVTLDLPENVALNAINQGTAHKSKPVKEPGPTGAPELAFATTSGSSAPKAGT